MSWSGYLKHEYFFLGHNHLNSEAYYSKPTSINDTTVNETGNRYLLHMQLADNVTLTKECLTCYIHYIYTAEPSMLNQVLRAF